MDIHTNDLDFKFPFDRDKYPLDSPESLQDIFAAAQHEKHFSNPRNFSDKTDIRCFDLDGMNSTWRHLDTRSLSDLLQNVSTSDHSTSSPTLSPASNEPNLRPRRLLAFFVPLSPAAGTSFGSCSAMTRDNVKELFQTRQVNPLFIMNLLGRPDYWAPQTEWHTDDDGNFLACDFFCQHPRWNLQVQGASVSVYMRYSAALKLTTYIISHKNGDSSIRVLTEILGSAMKTARPDKRANVFLNDPFNIAIMLSTLSFEASKYHVQKLRRAIWTQV
ncbi:hypothetical protein IFM60648_00816 [Aspergillus lentulus]|uniref:Uncharacterized protein n=1 Tax=Aspergillus lentulus TaxID=293939 RepID=A0ABQ0ZSN1_ASPLE|nr:hypothetical protein IFM60648_00816 [Aspergillus lentulus]GFF77238.1 hypothetical protein IFM62136_09518 [Aspergillus lentulus]